MRDLPDVHVAKFEDAVVRQQPVQIVHGFAEGFDPIADVCDQVWRQILMNAAGTEIRGMHPRAAGPLVEDHQFLAFDKPPQGRGQCSHVHGLGGDIEQMRKYPRNLAEQNPDQLATPRHG
ncbi:hypothetical protein X739_28390 [Mesorhizobium sp. LNHC220B00]|nr:hypothetical protein X739_28390 [Mesorhizobium sp. LNHC220B00]